MVVLFGGVLPKGTDWDSSRIQWKDFFIVPIICLVALGLMKSEHDRTVLRAVYGTLFAVVAVGVMCLLTGLAILGPELVVHNSIEVGKAIARNFKFELTDNNQSQTVYTEL